MTLCKSQYFLKCKDVGNAREAREQRMLYADKQDGEASSGNNAGSMNEEVETSEEER